VNATAILSPSIPSNSTEIPGLDLAVAYLPAGIRHEGGGDFYDIFAIGPDDWMVAIGDVSGKGFEAALVTVLVRDAIRRAALRNPQPSQVLRSLNHELLRYPTTRFCTAALIRLRRAGDCWKATVSLGGHPLPLLLDAGAAKPIGIGRPGTLIGALGTVEHHDRDVLLTPGAQVVLYTDGVCEARRQREFYGEDRLRSLIASQAGTAATTTDAVLHDVLAFRSSDLRDDIAIVVLRIPLPR
jgi:phosphoserine phosphatase RsbU/P